MQAGLIVLCLAYVLSQFFRAFLAVLSGVMEEDIGTGPDVLASCPQPIRGRIEARGVGILRAADAAPARPADTRRAAAERRVKVLIVMDFSLWTHTTGETAPASR